MSKTVPFIGPIAVGQTRPMVDVDTGKIVRTPPAKPPAKPQPAPKPEHIQKAEQQETQAKQARARLPELRQQLTQLTTLSDQARAKAVDAQTVAENSKKQADKDDAARKSDDFHTAEAKRLKKQSELKRAETEAALRDAQAADSRAQRAPSKDTQKAQRAHDQASDDLEFNTKLLTAAEADGAASAAEQKAAKYAKPTDKDLQDVKFMQEKKDAEAEAARLRKLSDRTVKDLEGVDLRNKANDAQRKADDATAATSELRSKLKAAEDKGDTKEAEKLKAQLASAIDAETTAVAAAKGAKAQYDLHTGDVAEGDALEQWRTQSANQYKLMPRDYWDKDGKIHTEIPAGWDPTIWMIPTDDMKVTDENGGRYKVDYKQFSEDKSAVVQKIDGQWYAIDGEKKTRMNDAAAAVWDARQAKVDAKKRQTEAGSTVDVVAEDKALDLPAWLDKAGAIGTDKKDADKAVTDARKKVDDYRDQHPVDPEVSNPPYDPALEKLRTDLADALQRQKLADANDQALTSIRKYNDAKRKLYEAELGQKTTCVADPDALKKARDAVATARSDMVKKLGDARTLGDTQKNLDDRETAAAKGLPKARETLSTTQKALDVAVTAGGAAPTKEQQSAIDAARRKRDLAQLDVDRYEKAAKAADDADELALSNYYYSGVYTDPKHNEYASLPAPNYSVTMIGTSVVSGGFDARTARSTSITETAKASASAADKAWGAYDQHKSDLKTIDDAAGAKPAVDKAATEATDKRKAAEKGNDPVAIEDARANETLAQQNKSLNDKVLDWGQAYKTLSDAQARDRAAGLAPDKPSDATKQAQSHVDGLRDQIGTLKADYKAAKKKQDVRVAQRTLDRANDKLDQWKRENPNRDPETSTAYVDVVKARVGLMMLQGEQTETAAGVAAQKEKDFVAQHLKPEDRDDPKSLHELFKKNPELMAQALMNSDAASSGGGLEIEMRNRTQLENVIGISLGWVPDSEIDMSDPAHWDQTMRTRDVFGSLTKEQKEQRKAIADQIVDAGGDTPTITVVPIVFSTSETGISKTALFRVQTLDQKTKFVDNQGLLCQGDSVEAARADFQAHSGLPADDVVMAMPELKSNDELRDDPDTGLFKFDDDGNVKLWHGDARTEGGWEHWKRTNPWFAPAVAVAGFAAGVAMTVGSFGLLSAPGAILIASSAYAIYEGGSDLIDMHQHGQLDSASDMFTNQRARMNGITLLGSALGLGSLGSGARAASLLANGGRTANAWRVGSMTAGWGAFGTGGVGFVDTGRYAIENWDHMSTSEKSATAFNLAINAMDLTGPGWQPGLRRGYQARVEANAAKRAAAATTADGGDDPAAGTGPVLASAPGAATAPGGTARPDPASSRTPATITVHVRPPGDPGAPGSITSIPDFAGLPVAVRSGSLPDPIQQVLAGNHPTALGGVAADGVPLPPTSHRRGSTWEDVAHRAPGHLTRQQRAHEPGSRIPPHDPSLDEVAMVGHLAADPAEGSGTRFVVSQVRPGEALYGDATVNTKRRVTHATFDEAMAAAAARPDGAFIYRVEPAEGRADPAQRGHVKGDELMGALHVDRDGRVNPVAFPNTRAPVWGRFAEGPPAATPEGASPQPAASPKGFKAWVAGSPRDTHIKPELVMATTLGLRLITAGAREMGFPVFIKYLSGPESSLAGYGVSGFSRYAWMTHGKAMKEAMALAVEGNRADAVKKVDKIIADAWKKGAKQITEAKANELRGIINAIADRSEAFIEARQAWANEYKGVADPKSFRIRQIRSPENPLTRLAPVGWVRDTDGASTFLRDLGHRHPDRFDGMAPARIADQLARSIHAMDRDTLARASDPSGTGTSPEAVWLRAHPEQARRFADTFDVRTRASSTHKALFDELMTHLANDKGTELEPNKAEPLPGSANTPGTRLGKASRQAAVALPMNTSLAWFMKGQITSDSTRVAVGHYADLLTLPSFAVKYIYSKKVDALADFNEQHPNGIDKNDPEQVAALKKLQDAKDRWNAIGDHSGWLSAGRATLAGIGFMGLGEGTLAGMAFTQAALTGAWVLAQRTPKIFTPEAGPERLTVPQGVWRAVRWGTIISAVGAPLGQYIWQQWIDPKSFERDPSLAARGGKALDGWLDSLFTDGRDFPGAPRPGIEVALPTQDVDEPYRPDWPEAVDWIVDGDNPDRATFTGMAEAKGERDDQTFVAALDQLFNLNPRFRRSMMDGEVTASYHDPDLVQDGERIHTGIPAT